MAIRYSLILTYPPILNVTTILIVLGTPTTVPAGVTIVTYSTTVTPAGGGSATPARAAPQRDSLASLFRSAARTFCHISFRARASSGEISRWL